MLLKIYQPDLIQSVVESNDVAESNKQLVLTVDARGELITK